MVGDSFAVVLAIWISFTISGQISDFPYYSLYAVLTGVWLGIVVFRKDYKIGRTTEVENTIKKLFGSLVLYLASISIFLVSIQDQAFSPAFFLYFVFCLAFTTVIYRVSVHLLLKQYRIKGKNFRNAVIIGKGTSSNKLAEVFNHRKDFGIKFLGYYDDIASCRYTRGNLSKFFEEADAFKLDLIYINERIDLVYLRKIIDFADDRYIKVKIIPESGLQLGKNLSFSQYGDFYVINVNEIPLDNAANRLIKRLFDLTFSLFVCIFILSWLIPLVGILIKIESSGPVFFVQKRNGVNNRIFECLKFRSMTPNNYEDSQQAIKNDPRVTKIGAFLRSTSMDEMPQFIYVLMGKMSIVGPRPHTEPMNQLYRTQIEKYNSRHKIKPGITGLAQVKGFRGEIENPHQIRSRVKLDYFYIRNWTFGMDIGICFRTIHELIYNRDNAY